MGFPYTGEENFEAGGAGDFNSETDTDSRLDFPHYSTLAAIPGTPMPWRGAYCMRVKFGAGFEADAYVQENDSWDVAAAETQYFRFMFWVDKDMSMSDGDEFVIWKLESTGPVTEAAVFLNYTTANGFRIGMGETSGTSYVPITLGKWTAIEIAITLDDGASNDGTIDLWVDGGQSASQITSLDQAAVIQGLLGVVSQTTSAITGTLYFDDPITDDARLYFPTDRFPTDLPITKSAHAFVGPGIIENATLVDAGNGNATLECFDTDTGTAVDETRTRLDLRQTTASEVVDPAGMPLLIKRGAYISLGGTSPKAYIKIRRAPGYGSEGSQRIIGRNRKASGIDA